MDIIERDVNSSFKETPIAQREGNLKMSERKLCVLNHSKFSADFTMFIPLILSIHVL